MAPLQDLDSNVSLKPWRIKALSLFDCCQRRGLQDGVIEQLEGSGELLDSSSAVAIT